MREAEQQQTGRMPGQDSFLGRAVRLVEQRRFAAAEATCKAVLAHDPAQLESQLLLGLSLGAQGAAEEAGRWLDRVARARPRDAHPCHALTGLLQEIGLPASIVPQYRACLRLAPREKSLAEALAAHLRQAGDAEAALETLRPALLSARPSLQALLLAGKAMADLGQFEQAAETFRALVARDADEAGGWSNLGIVLKVMGRFDEALAAADRAVSLAPGDAQIRLNRAMVLLRAGRLAEAWDDYDARLDLGGRSPLPAARLLRDLEQIDPGQHPIVLVVHDCGFGDTLNFIRHAAELADRGAQVVAWVPPELCALLGRVPGVAPSDAPAPPFNWHCHATDLPRICRATLQTISSAPYLHPEPAAVARWARRLGPPGAPRIGLAWAGQARPWLPDFDTLDSRRSMPLAALAPLAAVGGVTWISLQKGPPCAQLRDPPPGLKIWDLSAELTDFAETASLVANLDAVLTVDTSVAHLAGGTGARVLMLDRYDACWRWFHGRTDSPWYRNLRILRQERLGEWLPVVRQAAEAIRAMTGPGSGLAGRPG